MLVPVGTRPAFPAVDAAADEIGHHIDAGAIVATRIPSTVVHVYIGSKKGNNTMTFLFHIKTKRQARWILTVIAGESLVTFGANTVKRVDTVDAGPTIPTRAIRAVVNVYQTKHHDTND